jgi:hypothetical protein
MNTSEKSSKFKKSLAGRFVIYVDNNGESFMVTDGEAVHRWLDDEMVWQSIAREEFLDIINEHDFDNLLDLSREHFSTVA